jgi:hypothetical protein
MRPSGATARPSGLIIGGPLNTIDCAPLLRSTRSTPP